MELDNKLKRSLKTAGQQLDVAVTVGKAGLSDALIAQVRRALAGHELIKVRLPAGEADDRAESAKLLAEAVGAALVTIVGRNALLYRSTDSTDKEGLHRGEEN